MKTLTTSLIFLILHAGLLWTETECCSAGIGPQLCSPWDYYNSSGLAGLILNLDNSSLCSGKAVRWRYSYYVDQNEFDLKVEFVVYRSDGNGTYQRVENSTSRISISSSGLTPGTYMCAQMDIKKTFDVKQGDIVGACFMEFMYTPRMFERYNDERMFQGPPSSYGCTELEKIEINDFSTVSGIRVLLELDVVTYSTSIPVTYSTSKNITEPSKTIIPSVLGEREGGIKKLNKGVLVGINVGLVCVIIALLLLVMLLCCFIYCKRQPKVKKVGKNDNISRNTSSLIYNSLYVGETETARKAEIPYFKPATTETGLYMQILQQRLKKVPHQAIEITRPLGKGHFGVVDRGIWHDGKDMTYEVAIKSLEEGVSKEEKIKLLQEAAIMGQFNHPNVLRLYGVMADSDMVRLVMEMAHNGDMKKYLHTLNRGPPADNLEVQQLSYSTDIANGMVYLSHKGFVHRDLAARNILVTMGKKCKIGDFGMSRDLQDDNYYVSHNTVVPIKWTAPEAIRFRKYSTASDVWSYGCLLYEIWTLGEDPWSDLSNSEVIAHIDAGSALLPPSSCPSIIHRVMAQCWQFDPQMRPKFSSIAAKLTLDITTPSISKLPSYYNTDHIYDKTLHHFQHKLP